MKRTDSTKVAVGSVPATDAPVVKAFDWIGLKTVAVSGSATAPVASNVGDWAVAVGEAKLCGWMGRDIGMDGSDKLRSPKRSTLLGGSTLAVGAGAGAADGMTDACTGGMDGTAADSNVWKSPLGLQYPDNCLSAGTKCSSKCSCL